MFILNFYKYKINQDSEVIKSIVYSNQFIDASTTIKNIDNIPENPSSCLHIDAQNKDD